VDSVTRSVYRAQSIYGSRPGPCVHLLIQRRPAAIRLAQSAFAVEYGESHAYYHSAAIISAEPAAAAIMCINPTPIPHQSQRASAPNCLPVYASLTDCMRALLLGARCRVGVSHRMNLAPCRTELAPGGAQVGRQRGEVALQHLAALPGQEHLGARLPPQTQHCRRTFLLQHRLMPTDAIAAVWADAAVEACWYSFVL